MYRLISVFIFLSLVYSNDSSKPCENEIFNIALEKGLSNLSFIELELYNAMTQLCENESISTSSNGNEVLSILSKVTLFCDLGSVINPNLEYSGNLPPFELIGLEFALNEAVSIGVGFGKSSFKGMDYIITSHYVDVAYENDLIDATETYTTIAIGGLYRLGYFNLGGFYLKDAIKMEAEDPNGYYTYEDYDVTRTMLSPFIGCELPISDKISLELRNYFHLIYFDVEIDDYEEKATGQNLYLKFSI